ncbi:MAG: signal transduction histidine kinase, partial [Chthonomonadales bacterium]|nr:signal transduction histidine kinase [Chthonomonadales bacterium]
AKDEGDAAFLSIKSVMDQFLPILQATLGERRLIAEVEEISVSGKQATSLAIIANELVSNAMKHGKGDIELTLQSRDNLATLEVCDDGPGFDAGFDPAIAAHTGLELIENIARYDLRGETVYENREQGGARITVVFPTQHPISH